MDFQCHTFILREAPERQELDWSLLKSELKSFKIYQNVSIYLFTSTSLLGFVNSRQPSETLEYNRETSGTRDVLPWRLVFSFFTKRRFLIWPCHGFNNGNLSIAVLCTWISTISAFSILSLHKTSFRHYCINFLILHYFCRYFHNIDHGQNSLNFNSFRQYIAFLRP